MVDLVVEQSPENVPDLDITHLSLGDKELDRPGKKIRAGLLDLLNQHRMLLLVCTNEGLLGFRRFRLLKSNVSRQTTFYDGLFFVDNDPHQFQRGFGYFVRAVSQTVGRKAREYPQVRLKFLVPGLYEIFKLWHAGLPPIEI